MIPGARNRSAKLKKINDRIINETTRMGKIDVRYLKSCLAGIENCIIISLFYILLVANAGLG